SPEIATGMPRSSTSTSAPQRAEQWQQIARLVLGALGCRPIIVLKDTCAPPRVGSTPERPEDESDSVSENPSSKRGKDDSASVAALRACSGLGAAAARLD